MGVLFTLFLTVISIVSIRADISDLHLEEFQWQVLRNTPAGDSHIHALLTKKTSLGLGKLDDSDIADIVRLTHPGLISKEQPVSGIFHTCGEVSARLLDDESSEFSFTAMLKVSDAPYIRANLSSYFQFQLFDFYYSNGLGDYLQIPEYVALLQPAAVLKLLKDFRKEERLLREIRFVANNSRFELFPAR